MPAPARANGCSALFLRVWLIGWTVCVLPFDVFLGCVLFQQARATTFPTAEGVVTRSNLVKGRGDEGPVYQLAVAYDYEVNGQKYTGSRYNSVDLNTGKRSWQRVADELPVGARVPVYYDPADPAESMLRPGPTGAHIAMVWFLTPFNLIMVGGWVMFARVRRPAFGPHAVKSIADGYRVRLPAYSRAGCGAGCLLAITFCGVFVWGFVYGFDPPVELAAGTYLGAVALAVLLAVRLPVPLAWVEVDERTRVLRFPAKPEPLEISFAAIRAVTVRHEEKTDSEGDVQHEYHCELVRAGKGPFNVATYSDPESAEAFASWLRARVRITAGV